MKKQHITLNEEERHYLDKLLSQGELPVKTCKRALALLELDRGETYKSVAETVRVSSVTVSTWTQNW